MASSSASSGTNDQPALSRVVLEYGLRLAQEIVHVVMEDLRDEFNKEVQRSDRGEEDSVADNSASKKVSLQSAALGIIFGKELDENTEQVRNTEVHGGVPGIKTPDDTDSVGNPPEVAASDISESTKEIPKIEITSDTEDGLSSGSQSSSSEDDKNGKWKKEGKANKQGEETELNQGEHEDKSAKMGQNGATRDAQVLDETDGEFVAGFGVGFTRHSSGFTKQANENQELRKKYKELEETVESMSKRKEEMEEQMVNDRNKIQELTDIVEKLRSEKEELQGQLDPQASVLSQKDKEESKNADLRVEIAELRTAKEEVERSLKELSTESKEASETSEKVVADLKGQVSGLTNELEHLETKLQEANSEVSASKISLNKHEESSREQQEHIENLTKTIEEQTENLKRLKQELEQAHEDEKKVAQEKSKVESKLSNAQTHTEHQQTAVQKLRRENAELQEKLSIYEEKNGDKETALVIDQMSQDSHRKSKDRVRELQQKVIQLNDEKQALQHSYDESVKALEAVDKVYKMKEQAANKYKSDLEEALDKLQTKDDEMAEIRRELSDTKERLQRAEVKRAEREELKAKLKRAKETNKFQKTQIEDIRSDFKEQLHEAMMTQTRAKECDRKNQMLQLELTEVKDTLSIAKNVIAEKEKNMSSLKENLETEQQNTAKLEQEAKLHVIVKERLDLTEEDKKKLEKKLESTEKELEVAQSSLAQANDTNKELQANIVNLQEDNRKVKVDLEECQNEVRNLKTSVTHKEKQLEAQLMKYIHAKEEMNELSRELDEVCLSYQNDREWWRKRAEKVLGRRPKSAPPRRGGTRGVHGEGTNNFDNSAQRRRLGKKLGNAQLNPRYINSRRTFAWSKEDQTKEDSSPTAEPGQNQAAEPRNDTGPPAPQLSPRPPSAPPRHVRNTRPASSYGIRTFPPWRPKNDVSVGRGYYSDMDTRVLEQESLSACDDEELLAKKAVHTGDRVMIQSSVLAYKKFTCSNTLIAGEEKLNIAGVVKYVGKIGGISAGRVYVGLKLDQPLGDSDGRLGGKGLFKCPPRHGMMVRPEDIHAVMNPRTQIYQRVNSLEYC